MRNEKVWQIFKGLKKSGPKVRERVRKSPETLCMFNSVQKHPNPRYRTTRDTPFIYRLYTVHIHKCRVKGDTSEPRFRSVCKMAFLAPRTRHISSYSCPFDLVPSRIESPKCSLQNRVLGFQYSSPPPEKKTSQNDRFWPKKPKNCPKG